MKSAIEEFSNRALQALPPEIVGFNASTLSKTPFCSTRYPKAIEIAANLMWAVDIRASVELAPADPSDRNTIQPYCRR